MKGHKGRKQLPGLLLALVLSDYFLSACTNTCSHPHRDRHTSPHGDGYRHPTPTQTPTVTPTAEPAWYQPLDPAFGVLKYQYAEVINQRAKVYASIKDAIGKTGNFGYLPKFPAYVAYTTTETQDEHTYYFLPVVLRMDERR